MLLASHDGEQWIEAQLRSILAQRDVDVRILVSDDASTDGTRDVVARMAVHDERVVLLPGGTYGSAIANFLHLIREADVSGADAVAFSDQDDVWHLDRLARQLPRLDDADGTSGNVTAVYPRRRVLIEKHHPQRRLDFVCESAGPGSTFVLSPAAFARVREVATTDARVDDAAQHDWLVYAIVRAAGMRWTIAEESLLDYRQHGTNVVGANVGVRSALARLRQLRSGAFRADAARVARIASDVAAGPLRVELAHVAELLERDDAAARRELAALTPELRRRPREQRLLRAAIAVGAW
ncbi:glycosyltransferase [Agrococcus sp. SGAir0287]|uniref:glycosyltransferase n=1 Tax=Agrococcus sp. SGAir0287 TaxID=2070347 RepID=UPI0015868875|nr:glycosyltransferase [Agrococcus sp. SGAir0287]